jgi:ubiquinone/menaquinone biosynthesis C-methylase UbiE
MSIYGRFVFPRLLDFAMKTDDLTELRAKMIPGARGVVLEVGIGSGLNLPFYDATRVTTCYGVDPSGTLLSLARERAKTARFPVLLLQSKAEHVPLPDVSIDSVVVTWSLCSIRDPHTALTEMQRVLRPDGQLIFIEHGLAPDAHVQSWQNRLTPLWRRVVGGCHLNREMDELIRSAGFSITSLERSYIRGPRPVTYTYAGTGVRV